MRSPPPVNPRELIDPRADGHFANWARWMQNYQVGIGYDQQSAVVTGYGSTSIDDMYADMDRQHAKVIDAIIGGLSQVQQVSIHNVYLAQVWRSPRANMVEVFVEAAAEVWRLAQKRGVE